MQQQVTLNLECPEGYEFTGEYRKAESGEWYFHEGIAKRWNAHTTSCAYYFILRKKQEYKPLDQSVFVGQDKKWKCAAVDEDGKFFLYDTCDMWRYKEGNHLCEYIKKFNNIFQPGTKIDREFTADGYTYDEALELFRQGKLEVCTQFGFAESSLFERDWADGNPTYPNLKLSNYRKAPELPPQPDFSKFPGMEFCEINWKKGTISRGWRVYVIDAAIREETFAGWGYEINGEIRIAYVPVIYPRWAVFRGEK